MEKLLMWTVGLEEEVIVAGTYTAAQVDFDPDPISTFPVNTRGLQDLFLAAYEPDGTFLSAFGMGGSLDEYTGSLLTDDNGNIWIGGAFESSNFSLDPENEFALESGGASDIFWAAYRPICPVPEQCPEFCDFISMSFEYTDLVDDSCGVNLTLNNNIAETFDRVEINPLGPATFQNRELLDTNWTWVDQTPQKLTFAPKTGFITLGTSTLLSISPTDATDGPESIQVNYFASNELLCSDTLAIGCDSTINRCVEILSDTSFCIGNGFNYQFDWENTASFPVSSVKLLPISPDGILSDTTILGYDPPLIVGAREQTTLFFENVEYEGMVCFQIEVIDSLDRSFCTTDTICVNTPACAPFICPKTSLVAQSTSIEGGDCCFTLDLINDCQSNFFTGIQTKILGSEPFSLQTTTSDWTIERGEEANTFNWLPNSGIIDCDTTRSKVNFCFNSPSTGVMPQVEVSWLSTEPMVTCRDTIDMVCTEGADVNCVEIQDPLLTCAGNGDYNLQLGIGNNGSKTYTGIALELFGENNGVPFDSTIEITVNLTSGASFNLPPLAFGGLTAGDEFCVVISATDEVLTTGFFRDRCVTDTLCLQVPICDECNCLGWSNLSVSDEMDDWPALTAFSCGDTLQLPDCISDFCFDGVFQCNLDTCSRAFNWKVSKVGSSGAELMNEDMGNQPSFCVDLSAGVFPNQTTVPGLYELTLNGNCGSGACMECQLFIQIGCEMVCRPEIDCPSDIILDCPGLVELPMPTFSDTCGSNKTFTCTRSDNLPLEQPFVEDTTLITCRAIDELGFVDTCTYRVIINSTAPILLTCPDSIMAATLPGDTLVAVNYPDPMINNNCNVSLAYSMPSGSLFGCGMTTVTCTAIDTVQLDTVTCTFEVIVDCIPINPCDSLIISGVRVGDGEQSCCYEVSINNNFTQVQYQGLVVEIDGPTLFADFNPGNGWVLDSSQTTSKRRVILFQNGSIPLGETNNAFNLCTENFASRPHNLIVSWLEENGMQVCADTLALDCRPKDCCRDEAAFNQRAAQVNLQTTYGDCSIRVMPSGLGECDEIYFDWDGDGIDFAGPFTNGMEASFVYDDRDTFTVCYRIIEMDVFGNTCYMPFEDCLDQPVICEENCCNSQDNYEERVAAGFTFSLDNCKLIVTPNDLNECDEVTWTWGDGASSSGGLGNMPQTYFYNESGQYEVCMQVKEIDEDGSTCWENSENCQTFDVNCNPTCVCGLFGNVMFGQEPIDIMCGADPITLDCPKQGEDFKLTGSFNCDGNCTSEMIQYQIYRGGTLLVDEMAALNNGALDLALTEDLFKEVGTYRIVLIGFCDERSCPCEFTFIIPESCDCRCPEVAPIQLIADDMRYNIGCNDMPIDLGCFASNLQINGFFGCEGNACTGEEIQWSLIQPNGDTINNTSPAGDFQFELSNTIAIIPGMYTLQVNTNCGVNECSCEFQWMKEDCDPCICPIQEDYVTTMTDCNLVRFNFAGLEECDSVKVIFGDGTGTVALGGDTIEHWYPSRGVYSTCYFVKRTPEFEEPCTFSDCFPISIDCFTGISKENNQVDNGGFSDFMNQEAVGWNLETTERTSWVEDDGCDDPNYVSFKIEANEVGTNKIDQDGRFFAKDQSLQVSICMAIDRAYGLMDFTPIPKVQIIASKAPLTLEELLSCDTGCELVGEAYDLQIENEWVEMRLADWIPSDTYGYLHVITRQSQASTDNFNISVDNVIVSSLTTSLEDQVEELLVDIYPNPAQSELFIDYGRGIDPENDLIRILNVQGQITELLVEQNGVNGYRVDMGQMPSGVYFVQIIDRTSGVLVNKKLVKQ